MLPPNLKRFFWDIRIEDIDLATHKDYVISRILEFGDGPAVQWLEDRFTAQDIGRVVGKSRVLSPKSRNYWRMKYHVLEHA